MKKLLPLFLSVLFLLAACSNNNGNESNESVKVDDEKEEMTTETFLEKASSEHEDVKSYEQQGTFYVTDNDDNSQEIDFIVTHDNDDNLKFEADVDGDVFTYYDVDDEVKKVKNGSLEDTDEFSYDGESTYGDILNHLTELPKGQIEKQEDNYVLTFDISNVDDLTPVFGEDLSDTLKDVDMDNMTLELTFNKNYLLTQAKSDGEITEDDTTYSLKGTTNFDQINNEEEIELPGEE